MLLLPSGKSMRSSVAGHDCTVIEKESNNTNTRLEKNANDLEAIIYLLLKLLRPCNSTLWCSVTQGAAHLAAQLLQLFGLKVRDGLLELLASRSEARAYTAARGDCLPFAQLVRQELLFLADVQFEFGIVAI